MRPIILSSVASLALPYFFALSHNLHDFRKKVINIKFVFWFSLQLLPQSLLILRIEQDITKFICLYVKHSLFLSDFNAN